MIRILAALVVLLAAAIPLGAASGPISKFADLPVGSEAKFVIAVHSCYTGTGPRFEGKIKRLKKGWRVQWVELPEEGGCKEKGKAQIGEDVVRMWDEALVAKVYGESDVQLTGGISITITWPNGARTETAASGDDERIFDALDATRRTK
jgi:hypothetical protein